MNISTGIDIIEIETIKRLIEKYDQRFLRRVFTESEIAYCEGKPNKYQHYAVRYAAKEATMKALGYGWDKGVQWKHLEVYREKEAKPQLRLYGRALELFHTSAYTEISLSLTHCRYYAMASVIFI